MKQIDQERERDEDVEKVISSKHPRKIVVASPGTGKTFLFNQIIKRRKKKGKANILALTFIGKLSDELADELAGLADTMTLHGFAKSIVESEWKGSGYYPKITDIIEEDLKIKGITDFEVGDKNYKERTLYYKAVGHNDVVHYALQIWKKDENKIPKYDLIVVDEFQDFNETEADLVDLLATKNVMLVVGDDDQALYAFKGSFSKFIRERYDKSNKFFESHTLKYCSRCTEAIIRAFHNILSHYVDRGKLKGRISDKKYVCYLPDKNEDSGLNRKIVLLEDIPPGMNATKIKSELSDILMKQKIKSVLITGEARTCKSILSLTARGLREFGFRNVEVLRETQEAFVFKPHLIAAYKMLEEKSESVLAWRLLLKEIDDGKKVKKIILENYSNAGNFVKALPAAFKKKHKENAKVLERILKGPEYKRSQIAKSSIKKLANIILGDKAEKEKTLMKELVKKYKYLPRPLANLDITVCNILRAKGLGADVVFLVGFDQGKLPAEKDPEDSEILQMLVALTRTKKRLYLVNTVGNKTSQFVDCIDSELIQKK